MLPPFNLDFSGAVPYRADTLRAIADSQANRPCSLRLLSDFLTLRVPSEQEILFVICQSCFTSLLHQRTPLRFSDWIIVLARCRYSFFLNLASAVMLVVPLPFQFMESTQAAFLRKWHRWYCYSHIHLTSIDSPFAHAFYKHRDNRNQLSHTPLVARLQLLSADRL